MDGFRLEIDAALQMARLHEDAAAALNDLAPSQPTTLDGGLGGPLVMEILAALSLDAGRLADVNSAIAARVRRAVDTVEGYDEAAVADFRRLGSGLS